MIKNTSRHILLTMFVCFMIVVGCNNTSSVTQTAAPSPTSTTTRSLGKTLVPVTPTPTLTPVSVLQLLEFATATLDFETPIPDQICNQIPEPQLVASEDVPADIHLLGTFYLCYYYHSAFDMDDGTSGHIDVAGREDDLMADIYLGILISEIGGTVEYFVWGTDNAYITESSMEIPTREHCRLKTSNPIPRGGYINTNRSKVGCVLTNEGRVGFVRVDERDSIGEGSIKITFVTWK